MGNDTQRDSVVRIALLTIIWNSILFQSGKEITLQKKKKTIVYLRLKHKV